MAGERFENWRPAAEQTPCCVTGCERMVVDGKSKGARGMCPAHFQRALRGQSLTNPPLRRRLVGVDLLEAAALRYAEAETDEEFKAARAALVRAAVSVAAHRRGEAA